LNSFFFNIGAFFAYVVPEDTEKVNYRRPGFFKKFLELNQVMWETNKGLTQSHPFDSRPEVKKKKILFCVTRNSQTLLIGLALPSPGDKLLGQEQQTYLLAWQSLCVLGIDPGHWRLHPGETGLSIAGQKRLQNRFQR
jgi:hypothetical protein